MWLYPKRENCIRLYQELYQIVSESEVAFEPLLGVFSTVETEENTKIFGKAYTNFVR